MKNNGVLLINPQATEIIDKEYISTELPNNLLCIASVLEQEGAEVKLIDFCVKKFKKEEFIYFLKRFCPNIIGFTSMTPSIDSVKQIARIIKGEYDKKALVILGGAHVTAIPERTLRDIPEIDIGVIGEGEETTREIYSLHIQNKPFKNVNGIAYRNENRINVNPKRELIMNLDAIPFPARHLVNIEDYKKSHVDRGISRKQARVMEIMTSRGCPNRCIFCAGHINYGCKVRFRSFDNIISEIEFLIKRYKINHLYIEDDTFTLNRELVKKLCSYFKKKRLSWNCNSRVDTVDFKTIKMMKDSGCLKISFGVESGSQRILKLIKKNISLKQIKEAFKNANKAGIRYVEGTFMLGSHPDERKEDIDITLKLIRELMPDFVSLSVMSPYPGTEVYNIMINEKLLSGDERWSDFVFIDKLPYKKLNHFSSSQLLKIQENFLKRYYSSPKYIIKQIIKIRRFGELIYFMNLGFAFFSRFILNKKSQNN